MLIAIILLFVLGLPILNILFSYFFKSGKTSPPIYIGHRGAGQLAPENTIPAIELGVSYGMNWIEVDVRLSQDNQIILMHDVTLNRTTDKNGKVYKTTYEEMRLADASRSCPGYGCPVAIPLFKDVLYLAKASSISLMIEVKGYRRNPQIINNLIGIIGEAEMQEQIVLCSFNSNAIGHIKTLAPKIKTARLTLAGFPDKRCEYIGLHWLSIVYFPWIVSRLHRKGLAVLVWTIKRPIWMIYSMKWRADGIITDRPDIVATMQHPTH